MIIKLKKNKEIMNKRNSNDITIIALVIFEFINTMFRAFGMVNINQSIILREFDFIILLVLMIKHFISQKKIDITILKYIVLYLYIVFISSIYRISNITEFSNIIMPLVLGLLGCTVYFSLDDKRLRAIIYIGVWIMLFLYYSFVITGSYAHDPTGINSIYYFLLSFPLILCFPKSLLKLITVILITIVVVISMKSTALIILISVLLIEYYYHMKDSSLKRIIMPFFILLFFVIAIFMIKRFLNIDVVEMYVKSNILDGGNGRTEIWKNVINMFKNSNIVQMIFGHGYNAVANITGLSAHNDYLELLFDFGILGFCGFISTIFYWIKSYFKMKKLEFKYSKLFLMVICELLIIFFFSSCYFQASYYLMIVFILFSLINNYKVTKRKVLSNE